jgi:uncharacterized membrane protein
MKQRASQDSRLAPHLALIAVQILFGTWPIFGKIVLRSMSTTNLMLCRLIGAAIVLALLQRHLRPLRSMPRRDLAWLTLCSIVGVVGNQFIYLKGLSLTTVINTTLLSTTIPAFTLLVSIILGHDHLSIRRVIGIALAASGVVYLINPFRADLSSHNMVGNLLVATSSLLYAIYIVISKDLFERYGALNVITDFRCRFDNHTSSRILFSRPGAHAANDSLADDCFYYLVSDSRCLLLKRLGTDSGHTEHSGNLHLHAAVVCFWSCAYFAW